MTRHTVQRALGLAAWCVLAAGHTATLAGQAGPAPSPAPPGAQAPVAQFDPKGLGIDEAVRLALQSDPAMSLFAAAKLGLVLSNNLLNTYIFWELVGLGSYLLIGFWYQKKSAADAAKKAFLTNRLGDFGFMLGILMVWSLAGTVEFGLLEQKLRDNPALFGGLATAVGLLLFCGAVGKSAQFPLHVWLPDAMEGPTPVSALIHAGDDGGGGRLHALRDFLSAERDGVGGGGQDRGDHGPAGCGGGDSAGRHQTDPGLFDALPTRLHGHGRRVDPGHAADADPGQVLAS